MKSLVLGLALATVSCSVFAGVDQSVGCFTSGKTNVKFVQIDQDGISLGYVKYQKSKVAIPLVM